MLMTVTCATLTLMMSCGHSPVMAMTPGEGKDAAGKSQEHY